MARSSSRGGALAESERVTLRRVNLDQMNPSLIGGYSGRRAALEPRLHQTG